MVSVIRRAGAILNWPPSRFTALWTTADHTVQGGWRNTLHTALDATATTVSLLVRTLQNTHVLRTRSYTDSARRLEYDDSIY